MTIVIPSMGVDHKRMPVQPKMVSKSHLSYILCHIHSMSGRVVSNPKDFNSPVLGNYLKRSDFN